MGYSLTCPIRSKGHGCGWKIAVSGIHRYSKPCALPNTAPVPEQFQLQSKNPAQATEELIPKIRAQCTGNASTHFDLNQWPELLYSLQISKAIANLFVKEYIFQHKISVCDLFWMQIFQRWQYFIRNPLHFPNPEAIVMIMISNWFISLCMIERTATSVWKK